jgi:transcription termination factor NusB
MDKVYYTEMSDIIIRNENFFIQILEKYAPKFNISQMNTMYILPVYIGLAEIFYLTEEIPIKVSMNESIEIAKAF